MIVITVCKLIDCSKLLLCMNIKMLKISLSLQWTHNKQQSMSFQCVLQQSLQNTHCRLCATVLVRVPEWKPHIHHNSMEIYLTSLLFELIIRWSKSHTHSHTCITNYAHSRWRFSYEQRWKSRGDLAWDISNALLSYVCCQFVRDRRNSEMMRIVSCVNTYSSVHNIYIYTTYVCSYAYAYVLIIFDSIFVFELTSTSRMSIRLNNPPHRAIHLNVRTLNIFMLIMHG